MPSTIKNLDVSITVKNVARSAEWYQRMVGLTVGMAMPDKTKPTFMRLRSTMTGPAVMLSDGTDPFTGKKAPKAVADAVAAR